MNHRNMSSSRLLCLAVAVAFLFPPTLGGAPLVDTAADDAVGGGVGNTTVTAAAAAAAAAAVSPNEMLTQLVLFHTQTCH
jgi:hypothetical protein